MRFPLRLKPHHPLRKIVAAAVVAAGATLLAAGAHAVPGVRVAMAALDNTFYDAFYKLRTPVDRSGGSVVIITADETSMEKLADANNLHWPWPRVLWGDTVKYMEACGAKAVAFDLVFKEPAGFDKEFAKAVDAAKVPVIFGNRILNDGRPDRFALRPKKPPTFGAVNVSDETVIRTYHPEVRGTPSLAVRAAQASGAALPDWAARPFLLHYFGPNKRADDRTTFRYIPAYAVFKAAQDPARAGDAGISPEMFRGKVVLVGGTALAVYDQKAAPVDSAFPGVEVQATAIDDLLQGLRVRRLSLGTAAAAAFQTALLAALGVVLPRRASFKVFWAGVAMVALFAVAATMFRAHDIRWLPMASPIFALIVASVGAFAWSYLSEDRQRRLVLKALSQYVSPEVASEIERDPATLKLGGQRREMTVLFSDIQGFTDLSESMDSQKLSEMLNFYLGEMSALILENNGTLDKYIGDAIMSFWNAPVVQADHAALACRAALAMRDREAQIQDQLAALGARDMLTRIGINTGPMVFGNMGAPQKFNYSVLGDSVNLGSRLEGANKFYGSRILIADSTAQLVKGRFLLRQLDVLRVKGKQQPLAVYEVLAEGEGDADLKDRAARYEAALALYQSQKWDDAGAILRQLHGRYPHDGPVAALLKRIDKLRDDPPPLEWDGVYMAKDK